METLAKHQSKWDKFRESHPGCGNLIARCFGLPKRLIGFVRGFCHCHQEILILTAVTLLVLLLLVTMDREIPEGDSTNVALRFAHRHGDSILLGLIIAFLTVVTWRFDRFRRELNDHKIAWKNSAAELTDFGRSVEKATNDLEGVRAAHISLLGASQESVEIVRGFDALMGQHTTTRLHANSAQLENGWLKAIAASVKQQPEGMPRLLEAHLWERLFDAYITEELDDIAYHHDGPAADRTPGPLMATNYPTYLRWLRDMSQSFADHVQRCLADCPKMADWKPCFFAVANTLPIEWLMRCVKQSNDKYVCHFEPQLSDWYTAAKNLATRPGVFFSRIFVTTNYPELGVKYNIPEASVFEKQLDHVVWTTERDKDFCTGTLKEVWDEFPEDIIGQKAPLVEFQSGTRCFHISTSSDKYSAIEVDDTEGLKHALRRGVPIRQRVIEELHAAPRSVTARRATLDSEEDFEASDELKHKPVDVLMVGLVSSSFPTDDANLLKDKLKVDSDGFIPLFAIENVINDPWRNLSMLRIYGGHPTGEFLTKWFAYLIEKSNEA